MAVQVLGKVAYFNKGAYNSQTNYEINDVVSYNGSSYVSLNDNNQGNLPTNTNYWSVVAEKGDKGDTGKPFVIEKTYSTIESMVADYDNMNVNDYVMIQGSIEEQENATLWTKREVEVSPYKWAYLADFSGASGITGATPNIHIGNVTEGNEPSVTRRSGSSNENPILDFVLKTGAKGDTGATGNGISSFEKTSTSSLVDTYTITFTNGTSTTIEVTNGRGIVSIVKTGTVDYVDTYTITYNDGTTSTFEVANSEVTEEEFNDVVDELNYLYDDLPKVEGEGTNLTLDNTRKGKISNVLKGNNLSQFTTTGKNLLKVASSTLINRNVTTTYNFETGVLSSTGVADSGWPWIVESVLNTPIPAGTQVTFSVDNVQSYKISMRIYESATATASEYSDYTEIPVGNLSVTKTLATGCAKIIILVNYGTGTTADTNMRLQLEVGSTPTEFELYTGGNPAPNPDYPQDVHVVSGNNNIDICGKNLFDKDNITIEIGSIGAGGSFSPSTERLRAYYIEVNENTQYTLSTSNNDLQVVPYFYDSSKNFLSFNNGWKNFPYTFTSPADTKYVALLFKNSTNTPSIGMIGDFQLEKGSTATTYQPFESQTYLINLGAMELCKIGNYQDYIAKSTGKNLFGGEVENGTLGVTGNKISNSKRLRTTAPIFLKQGTYTISAREDFDVICYISDSGNYGEYTQIKSTYSDMPYTFTLNSNKYILFTFNKGDIELSPSDLTEIQIELGTATSYEPYGKGKWYKHSEIGKQILDGTEAWVYSVTNLVFYSDVLQSPPVVKNSSRFYCNRFNYVSWNTSFENMLNGQGRYQADGNHRLILKNTAYTTSNDFKNWLSTNNTIVYYVLATPTNTEITDQTLIAQLDNFEKAISYNTQTNISQENNDLPFIISASAFMSLKYIFGNLETRVAELEG